jgi:hypothetical protein
MRTAAPQKERLWPRRYPWTPAVDLIAKLRLEARDDDLIASHGTWVLACGGPQGNGGHHGAFDQARTIRLPRAAVPPLVEGLALELGLDWWLDREYGPR